MPNYQGTIIDFESGVPILNASVESVGLNRLVSCSSNKSGKWELEVNENCKLLNISCKGFIPKKVVVSDSLNISLVSVNVSAYSEWNSYYPGEKVTLYVNCGLSYSYRILKYGKSIEEITGLNEMRIIIQDFEDLPILETGLKWKETKKILLPKNLVSGLYGVQLIDENKHEAVVPLVIKSKRQGSGNKMVIIANTFTWHANNTFGGKSRYADIQTAFLRNMDAKLWMKRALKSLFNKLGKGYRPAVLNTEALISISRFRPLNGIGLQEMKSPYEEYQSHLVGGEWRLLAWMEEKGYPYDYFSDFDIEENPEILDQYDTVVLNTHPKYWGENALQKLSVSHKNKKLNLLNFGGNALFSMVKDYNKMKFKILPKALEGESMGFKLLGVSFNLNSYSSCAPFKIMDNNHRIFNEIDTEIFGEKSLLNSKRSNFTNPQPGRIDLGLKSHKYSLSGMGASGWEVDCTGNNTDDQIKVVASGLNTNGGAQMVFRDKTEKSGLMFSASSVSFTGSLLVDRNISKLVENILNEANIIKKVK
jgi:hypothetical protein